MKPKCWSCETENPEYDDNDCCLVCDAPREIPDEVFRQQDEDHDQWNRSRGEEDSGRQQLTKPENVIVVSEPVL